MQWIISLVVIILLWSGEGCFAQVRSNTRIKKIVDALPDKQEGRIVSDIANKMITLGDGNNQLQIQLNYNGKCMLDDVRILGSQNIVSPVTGGLFCD
jgi:hypothetical protein